jgi:dipeptidyl aminopeptidase/acylaminoacyl peptidase
MPAPMVDWPSAAWPFAEPAEKRPMTEPARRPMVPEDLLRIRFVSDPQISPDGRRVAFVVTTLSDARDEYLSTIWMVDTDGGEARPFTRGPRRDTAPRWSPDGRWLAFVSERGRKDKGQVHVMPADGGEPLRLTDLRAGVAGPAWSPDGTRLAFVSRVGGWEEPEDEEERERSKPPRTIEVLKYKSNGIGFVYDRPRHVFVVDAAGGPARQLTDGPFDDQHPAWSPDGRWVAFVSARHPERDEDSAADVWVVSPEGGEPRRLTSTAGPASWPTFAPDGRTIAYLGHAYPRDVARHHRVHVVPVGGGPPACLTAALDRNCEPMMGAVGPQWLGGTGAILFQVEDEGDVPLYRVAAAGGAPAARVVGGSRQVTAFSVSADGACIAFTATDDVSPPEVFVCRADGSGERRLTDLNRGWRAEVALARAERFRFERAGFTIDGWVMPPVGLEPGRRYPALLNVHGGPASQYGHRFFDEFQVYAGAGYAVVYLNPRGSRGYDEAFARAVVGDWGGGDYADVMTGLDEALRRFAFLDPGRLGVMGGSYGGFMTSWIVGHTDRFRAACSERAVNALWSMFGTSDIGHAFQEAHAEGRPPWDDLKWYLEHSSLSYARDIRTPLLIMHSEDDHRCPIEQAEQLFVALKKLRRTVRFVRFPGEDHELSRAGRPRHRLARFRILLEWFREHLPPGAS